MGKRKDILKMTAVIGSDVAPFLYALRKEIAFHRTPYEELAKKREEHRQAFFDDGDPYHEHYMRKVDREWIRRENIKYDKEHPDAKPRHREHGWYLPNDE